MSSFNTTPITPPQLTNTTLPDSDDDPYAYRPFEFWQMAFIVTVCIECILAMCLNAFVFSVWARNRVLHTPPNVLVVNMVCADFFLTSVVWVAIMMNLSHGGWAIGFRGCQIGGFLDTSGATGSLLALLWLSVERYVLIVRGHSLTKRQVTYLITCGWVWMLLSQTIPFTFHEPYLLDMSGVYCIGAWGKRSVGGLVYLAVGMFNVVMPLVIFSCMYTLIIRHVKGLSKKPLPHFSDTSEVSDVSPHTHMMTQRQKVEMLVFRKATILMCVAVLAWVPMDIGFLWEIIAGGNHNKPKYLAGFGPVGVALNAVLNPILLLALDKRWSSCAIDQLPYPLHHLFRKCSGEISTLTTSSSHSGSGRSAGELKRPPPVGFVLAPPLELKDAALWGSQSSASSMSASPRWSTGMYAGAYGGGWQ